MKGRRYGDQGAELAASANGALLAALDVMLRLFAPFLPFVTDEVWSWWRPGTIHTAAWPDPEALLKACEPAGEDEQRRRRAQFAAAVLGAIRKKKSEEQRPLKTPVARAVIQRAAATARAAAAGRKGSARRRASSSELETVVGDDASRSTVELAPAGSRCQEKRP